MNCRVWVLNHFAVPLGQPGGTRHVELFGRLPGWDSLIFAARVNPSTRRRQGDEPGFCFVPVSPYSRNGPARILNWLSFAVAASLAGLMRAPRRPNVIYASSPHLLSGVAGALLSSIFRVPLVLEVRDLWPKVLADMGQLSERSWLYRSLATLESLLYSRADRIVVLAAGTRRVLVQQGVVESKIVLIPNGADPGFFATDASREQAREHYRFDRMTFVYTGAHGPANGLELLIDAAAETPGVDVVLVGDGVSRASLIDKAQLMNVTNVSFREAIPKSEMPSLLLAADVGVHCLADVPLFQYGVSPNKIFDYMAAAIPVLTNTCGEVAELVGAAESGIAVRAGDLRHGLALMAAASESQREQWGSNGAAYMTRHQSRAIMSERLLSLLNGVVEPGTAQW